MYRDRRHPVINAKALHALRNIIKSEMEKRKAATVDCVTVARFIADTHVFSYQYIVVAVNFLERT